jgi:hypothetical protein
MRVHQNTLKRQQSKVPHHAEGHVDPNLMYYKTVTGFRYTMPEHVESENIKSKIGYRPYLYQLFTRVYVRTTRVYHLLCCCCCCCSCWDISQNTAVYTKLVPFHHAFSILQCNLQFSIFNFNFRFSIFDFRFSIFDFYLISLLRPISTGLSNTAQNTALLSNFTMLLA